MSDNSEISNEKHFHTLNRNWKAGLLPTIQNFFEFKKLLKELNPKFVIANCELPELYIAASTPRATQIIAIEHTSNPWAGRKILGGAVRMILKIRGTLWITVSNSAGPIWKGAKHPCFIANPIALKTVQEILNKDRQELIFVGRLRAEKNPEWVIKAAIRLNLEIHIFGDGECRSQLENTYAKSHPNVHFQGFEQNPWAHIAQDALVVVPSDYEGDGMVVAEALISGRQVLLRDNVDLRRFQLPEENYFVDQEDLLIKIAVWNKSGKKSLIPPIEVIEQIKKARNIESITSAWCKILNIDSKNRTGEN